MNKDLEVVEKKVQGMKGVVEHLVILTDQDLAAVSDHIKNVKSLGKFIKSKKEEFTAPAKEIIEKAKEMFDGPIKECANAEEVLKAKAQKYLEDKEAARIKAEKKIEEDLAKGKIKKVETAVKKLENLPDQQKSITTEASGLRMQKRKICEILEPSLIPDEYWIIDETRLKKEALQKYNEGGFTIPGTIIKEVSTMVSN